MGNRPPFETFKGATCKGCLALGNACGHCEKCVWERDQMKEVNEVEHIPQILNEIAQAGNGKIDEVGLLPDGSGFATMSFPLRKDHWLYQQDDTPAGFKSNVPPMPFRIGENEQILMAVIENGTVKPRSFLLDRDQLAHAIRAAGKYAARCATMNGAHDDFDPDALLQNLVVGFLGYWTKDGLTGCAEDAPWCDPQTPFDFTPPPPRNLGSSNATGCAPTPPDRVEAVPE